MNKKVDKSIPYYGFRSYTLFFIQGQNITTKPAISVLFIHIFT